MEFAHNKFISIIIIIIISIEEITEGPQIRPSDRSGLFAFADQLKNCEHTLGSMGYLDEINSADNPQRIVQRLPFHLRTKFVEIADGIQQAGKRPNIKDISALLQTKQEWRIIQYSEALWTWQQTWKLETKGEPQNG